ncbi:MAG: ferredoxin [Actinomycetota bacterium]|jgi:ferredoxin|nr:ferredoxin [Actinomycetota bacterium]
MATVPNRYRLHIDWTRCDGRGLCTELLPDLLGRDKWGYPVALTEERGSRSDVFIPGSRLEAATDAVNLCPLIALALIAPTAKR